LDYVIRIDVIEPKFFESLILGCHIRIVLQFVEAIYEDLNSS